jgi:hypothetical protein
MITIGITTYNRKNLLELMASSLYESDISIPYNIKIYDDCSNEYGLEELKSIFPDAASIKINRNNLKADKNIYQMYSDFVSTSDLFLFNADSDLLFKKKWLNTALGLIKETSGILSLFNANSHESYKTINNELCLKKTIGSAGTLFTRDRVVDLLTEINSIEKVKAFDWQFSEYFDKAGLPIYCVNNSLVQHIGYNGQNTGFYFDFGRNYQIDTLEQGQIINDIFAMFIDDIHKKETERQVIIDKQNNSIMHNLYRCLVILMKKILPKKFYIYIKSKLKN